MVAEIVKPHIFFIFHLLNHVPYSHPTCDGQKWDIISKNNIPKNMYPYFMVKIWINFYILYHKCKNKREKNK